jgi:phage terminase large subunit-like protein
LLQFSVALTKFCNSVLSLESVKRVGIKARGESISVWTFADNPSHDVLAKIYAAELVFRNAIAEIIFDFAVKFEDTATVPPDFYVFQGS